MKQAHRPARCLDTMALVGCASTPPIGPGEAQPVSQSAAPFAMPESANRDDHAETPPPFSAEPATTIAAVFASAKVCTAASVLRWQKAARWWESAPAHWPHAATASNGPDSISNGPTIQVDNSADDAFRYSADTNSDVLPITPATVEGHQTVSTADSLRNST